MKQFQLTGILTGAFLAVAGCQAPTGDIEIQQQPEDRTQTDPTTNPWWEAEGDESSSAGENNTASNSSSQTSSSQSNNNNGGGAANTWVGVLQDPDAPRLPVADRVPALAGTADHGFVKRYDPVANPEDPLAGFRTFLQANNPVGIGVPIPAAAAIGNNHPTPNQVIVEAEWQAGHAAAGKKIQIVHGDITKEMGAPAQITAIVNAANGSLGGGGGVDGAIKTAAGNNPYNELTWANGYKAQHNGGNNVPVGSAVVSNPGNLATRNVNGAQQRITYMIHVVAPGGGTAHRQHLLYTTIWNALEKASRKNVQVISFPAAGTGIFHYPLVEAVQIFFQTSVQYVNANPGTSLETIRFTNIDGRVGQLPIPVQQTPRAFLTEFRRLLVD
ncbi:MAG: macro domain-containing protein [Myxococcota bacterium]